MSLIVVCGDHLRIVGGLKQIVYLIRNRLHRAEQRPKPEKSVAHL